jgi:hypothetical protein
VKLSVKILFSEQNCFEEFFEVEVEAEDIFSVDVEKLINQYNHENPTKSVIKFITKEEVEEQNWDYIVAFIGTMYDDIVGVVVCFGIIKDITNERN